MRDLLRNPKFIKFRPRYFDIFWSIKLKPRRCTSTIYSFTFWSFRTLWQRLHTKLPRTNSCLSTKMWEISKFWKLWKFWSKIKINPLLHSSCIGSLLMTNRNHVGSVVKEIWSVQTSRDGQPDRQTDRQTSWNIYDPSLRFTIMKICYVYMLGFEPTTQQVRAPCSTNWAPCPLRHV